MAASDATIASFSTAKLLTSSSTKFKQPLSAFSLFRPPTSLFSSSFATLPLHPHRRPRPRPRYLRFSTVPKISATISVGVKLPDATLSYFDSSDELQTISVSDLTSNKKAILIAVPGAFTPLARRNIFLDSLKKAWKENLKVGDEVLLLSDGNGTFTKANGCELDLSYKPVGLGVRSSGYAIYLEDGVVKILNLEEGGAFNVSSAEDLLKAL